MEAQDKESRRSCPRCFALVAVASPYCTECGVNFDGNPSGSDSEVYQDLAKANLLRMRGHSKEAMDVCLGILRRYPNNMTAHSLLGDIYFEKEDFKQAAEWYEMSLDLAPGSIREQQQLDISRRRMKDSAMAQSLDQLDIKRKPFNPTWYALGAIFALIGVAIAAFVIGQNSQKLNKTQAINDPITIQAPENDEPVETPTQNQPIGGYVLTAEETLFNSLKQKNGTSATLDSVVLLSEANHVIVTAPQSTATTDPVTALLIAGEVFGVRRESSVVTVRLHENAAQTFSGTISQDLYNQCLSMVESGQTLEAAAAFAFTGEQSPLPRDDGMNTPPDDTSSDAITSTGN